MLHILILRCSPAFEALLGQWQGRAVRCTPAATLEEAVSILEKERPDIVVADIPEGAEMQRLKALCPENIPIIALAKPLRAAALFETLDALFPVKETPLHLGGGLYLFVKGRVLASKVAPVLEEEKLKLTEKEVAILRCLYEQGGKPIERNRLLSEVWDYNPDVIDTHTLETHIYRLRQKVAERFGGSDIVVTQPGGYTLG